MDFRDRAQFEAERYGADPWIFVRELLQNARDAGATSVVISIDARDGQVRLACRDDGDGMTQEHSKRFLFRLYASSKEGAAGMAGRFGVGFWSILRFEPSSIVIRSWPKRGEPWEVSLDGQLKHAATVTPPPAARGTELVLTRPFLPEVSERVKAAARMHARFLMTRGDASRPLDVVIDGERITCELALPAPSATFHERGVRGVVALGQQPLVELFSKGLHVRTAASVDELLASPDESGRSRQLDPLLEGLAPQVILDGEELNLVRSRSDARDDRALRRAVELSRKELARLIERQLAFSRPTPLWKRALRPMLAVAATMAFLGGGGWLLSSFVRRAPPKVVAYGAPPAPAPPARGPNAPVPYRDPSTSYRGPRTDALPQRAAITDLDYTPASKKLHLASLHLQSPDDPARLQYGDVRSRYPLQECRSDCVRIGLTVDAQRGWLRVPVPSGHVLDAKTLTVNGHEQAVQRTPQGEPTFWVSSDRELALTYRTGPGVPVIDAAEPQVDSVPASVPDVSKLPPAMAARVLRDWVVDHIDYTNDPAVGSLGRGVTGGGDFIARTLAVGGGDCDVQNMVLAMLLQHAGVPARLAVGYLGREGSAEPLLHAWVEYLTASGWAVTDASIRAPPVAVGARSKAAPPGAVYSPEENERAAKRQLELTDPRWEPRAFTPAPVPERFQVSLPAVELPREALGLLGSAPLLGLVFLLLRPRVRRQTQLEEDHDVSKLLQGALARPEAFSHVPALFDLPLVPRRGGAPISLGLAYELAACERLYSSDVGAPFTERAVKASAVVIDAMRPEGKVVAEALGAVNLDRWDRLLRQAKIPPLLEKVNEHLRARGERWTLMTSEAVTREPAVLSVPGSKDDRWVVLNGDALWVARAAAAAETRPVRATFEVIDQVALWLRLPSARRARLLAPLARAALHEELNGGVAPPAQPPRHLETFDDLVDHLPPPGKVRS